MHSLFSYWQMDTGMIIFVIVLVFFYLLLTEFRFYKKTIYFIAALIMFIIAVASPLHFLGMNYLFSAHMVAHIILLLIAAPLMVAAIPANNRFKKRMKSFSKKTSAKPIVCWLIGVGIMWFWHIPYIFKQMMVIHDMAHVQSIQYMAIVNAGSLLLSGMLFSWPIINPYPQYRIAPMHGVFYLSIACVFCSLLGLLITFAPAGTYSYNMPMDPYGFSSIIKSQWRISAAIDRQMAGLIMWVPCCFLYLIAIMFLFKQWFNEKGIPTDISTNQNLANS